MKRNLLSGMLALCLLASSLCAALPLSASADIVGGTVTAVTGEADIPQKESLLTGLTPFWGNAYGSKVNIVSGELAYLEGTTSALADGKVQGIHVTADAATCAESALRVAANNGAHNLTGYDHWRAQVWISFDLGESKAVESLLIAHSVLGSLAEGAATGKLAQAVEVRVTDDMAALNSATPVMAFSAADLSGGMPTAMKLTLDAAVTGRYVGLYFTMPASNADYFATTYKGAAKKGNYIYLSEIAVYGADEKQDPVVTGGTMTAVTQTKDMPAGTNLVAGMTPYIGKTNTLYSATSKNLYQGDSLPSLTDGKVQGLDVISGAEDRYAAAARFAGANGAWSGAGLDWKRNVYITFDLGESKTVDRVLVSHSIVGAITEKSKTDYLYKLGVFISDDKATCETPSAAVLKLSAAETDVLTAENSGGVQTAPTVLLTLDEAKTGRYVTVMIHVCGGASTAVANPLNNNMRTFWAALSEIAVYGADVKQDPVVTGGTMTAVTKAEDLPVHPNLIGDAAPGWGYVNTKLTADNRFLLEGNIDTLTDGEVQGLNVIADEESRTASAARIAAANGAHSGPSIDQWKNYVYLTFDLGESKKWDTLLVAHSLIGALTDDADNGYAYKLGVFVGDELNESLCGNNIRGNAVLQLADKAENFAVENTGYVTTAPVVLFKLDEAKTGRYVTVFFEVPGKANGDPLLFTAADGKKYNWVYLSELGIYDSTAQPVEETYTVTRLNSEADAVKLPAEENLLAGIPVGDKNGSPLPGGNDEMSQQSDEALAVDGIINGITRPDPTEANKFMFRTYQDNPVTYDMRGQVEMSRFLVAADSFDSANYWIPRVEIYVGNRITTLFDSAPVASVSLKGKIAVVITLKQAVTARYVAFKIPATANVVRIGELGVYGAYQSHMGEVQSLIQGKLPAEEYICEPGQVDIFNKPEGFVDNVRWNENSEGLTDGNTMSRCAWTIISGDRYPTVADREYIQADTAWSVLIYHLGGTASVESIILTSTHEGSGDYRYYVAGADFYVGQTLKTLFDPANRVYTSGGEKTITEIDPDTGEEIVKLDPSTDILERVIRYDLETPVEGRYVAFVINRPHATHRKGYSISRVDELEVLGALPADKVEQYPQTTYTDEQTGCSLTIEQLNFDDTEFYNTIGGLQVTTSPWTEDAVVCNNWLQVDSACYTLTLVDKNGKTFTKEDLDGRTLRVTMKAQGDYAQGLGEVVQGQVQRIRNSRVVDGTILGNHIVDYPVKLVRLVFNEAPVDTTPYAADDVYEGGKTAGVTADISPWWALMALPITAGVWLFYVKMRKGGAAQ